MNNRKRPTMNRPEHQRVSKHFNHAEDGGEGAAAWLLTVLSNEDRSKVSANRIGRREGL